MALCRQQDLFILLVSELPPFPPPPPPLPSPPLPSFSSLSHSCSGGRAGREGVAEFKKQSYKYSAQKLYEKGVILEIEGLPNHQ